MTDPRIEFERGLSALRAGVWDAAVECFEIVTKLAPQVDVGHFNLGNAYFELRKFEQAERAYRAALNISPDAAAWNNLGNALSEMLRFEEAILAYERAAVLSKTNDGGETQTHLNLGKALLVAGHFDASVNALKNAWLCQPSNPRIVELYIQALAMLGKNSDDPVEEVKGVWDSAVAFPNCKLSACFAMSYLYELHGSWDKSLSYLVQAVEWFPDDSAVFAKLGQHHARRGRVSEATACIHRAATLTKPTPKLFSHWVKNLQSTSVNTAGKVFDEARQWNQVPVKALSSNDSMSVPSVPLASGCHEEEVDCQSHAHVIAILANHDAADAVHLQLVPYLQNRISNDEFRVDVYWSSLNDARISDAMRRSADNWIMCHQSSDESLAIRIAREKTALVVDMIGHGPDTRLGVAKLKPAPGYALWNYAQQTTGVGEVGFQIAMAQNPTWVKQRTATEEILITKFPFPPQYAELKEDQSSLKLKGNERSICSIGFAGEMKWITHESIDFWSRLLLAIEGSEFHFASHDFQDLTLREEVQGAFVRKGVSENRIQFEPLRNAFCQQEVQQWLAAIDVYAESLPGPSMTSTLHALSQGCLVVGVAGDSSPRALLHPIASTLKYATIYERSIQETIDLLMPLVSDIQSSRNIRIDNIQKFAQFGSGSENDYSLSVESAWRKAILSGKSLSRYFENRNGEGK